MTYREILQRYWGYDDFRGIQRQIIESVGAGRDTLGLMPTGGGKSITFQVPAMAAEGLCLVVTPLIALMKDQVQALRGLGIRAAALHSGMSREQIVATLDGCVVGEYKFLYVSPERLGTEAMVRKLRHMRLCLIAVDEAHCISQWGYDFRPSYLGIAAVRQHAPGVPVLALTASATPQVVDDIQQKLLFSQSNVIGMSFRRDNLVYVVRRTDDKFGEMLHILGSVPGSAIVYTRNRAHTDELAAQLCRHGVEATHYHAGMHQRQKDENQQLWQTGQRRVMVATNAFGMGIDKPDVRLVLHMQIPDSPEEYFQEAGRAGRDGLRAWAVLLHDGKDRPRLQRRVGESYPAPERVSKVYESLCHYFQIAMGYGLGVTREFDMALFCMRFKYHPTLAHSALQLLHHAGYIHYTEDDERRSRLMFTVTRDSLYRINNQSPDTDRVIRSLLRRYPGLFAQYVYIDEDWIAADSGLTPRQVYMVLKALAHTRVIDFVPRKGTDMITFCQRRVERDEVRLPPMVYEVRRGQYEQRIGAMIGYVEGKDVCHSQYLLEYFGEKDSRPCGMCDACRDGRAQDNAIRRTLLSMAAEGPLSPRTMGTLDGYEREAVARVADELVRNEELVVGEDGWLALPAGRLLGD